MFKRIHIKRSKSLFSSENNGFDEKYRLITPQLFKNQRNNLISKARHSWNQAISVFMPARCGLCQCISDSGFCQQCQDLLPWIANGCRQCGATLVAGDICGRCQNTRSEWQETIVPFHYVEPVATLIHQFKYQEMLSLASPFASMLASAVIKRCPILPDILVPVPLYTASLRSRGYNQSTILAQELGKRLEIRVADNIVVKSRQTKSQMKLSEKARETNVCGAFNVVESASGVSVAVVDDVITSSATVKEVCKTLRMSGCDQLSVWAIAKTTKQE